MITTVKIIDMIKVIIRITIMKKWNNSIKKKKIIIIGLYNYITKKYDY
jgi:hypothetical protein